MRLGRRTSWWTGALILGLALFSYWPALQGGLLWDDPGHLTAPELQSVAGLRRIWFETGATQQYYPVLHSAFWIEHRLWGDATLGYHLLNVLLHALSAGLLIAILRQLGVPGAVLAGLIFVVHPVGVESVAWISEQKNTLSLVFYLLAALAYLRFDQDRTRPAATRTYLLASALFALALLSKSVTATLPAALLVIGWWQRGRLEWRRDVPPLVPWFAAAAIAGLFTAWMERTVIGARGADFALTFVSRCLLAGRIVWFYLGKLLWPANLTFIYPRWDVSSSAATGWACLAGAAAVTALLWRARGWRRGPLAAWLFFAGSLFPVLGFFNVYPFIFSYVADHFQYLASLGIIAGVSAGLSGLFARLSPGARGFGWALGGSLVAVLGLLAHRQSRMYRDLPTLYATTIERNPGAWMAHYNLGILLARDGQAAEAIPHFVAAARLKPDFADAHDDLASALAKIPGRRPEALEQYAIALRLRPDFAEAHNNLANELARIPRRLPEAIEHYREALRLRPNLAEGHNNLARALTSIPGQMPAAIEQYEAALRLNPDYAEAHYNLAGTLAALPGRLPEALPHFAAAVRLEPENAGIHYDYAVALARIPDRLPEAIQQYEIALRCQPNFVEAHYNLANELVKMPGRLPEALEHYEAALRLRPDNAEAHNNAAVAYANSGNLDEAIRHLEIALRLDPTYESARRNLAQLRALRP